MEMRMRMTASPSIFTELVMVSVHYSTDDLGDCLSDIDGLTTKAVSHR
jgi:hypothetical protein